MDTLLNGEGKPRSRANSISFDEIISSGWKIEGENDGSHAQDLGVDKSEQNVYSLSPASRKWLKGAAKTGSQQVKSDAMTDIEKLNERLEKSNKRLKRKYEMEKQVNKELGKRVRKWKSQCKSLEEKCAGLEKLLAQHQQLLTLSPITSLSSPKGAFFDEIEKPALEVCVDNLCQKDGSSNKRKDLFSHVLIVDNDEEDVSFCWPPDDKNAVPMNISQFCFPKTTDPEDDDDVLFTDPICKDNIYIFMLSGSCSTPQTTHLSCLDDGIFGVCTVLEGRCYCILTAHPFFDLHCQLLDGIIKNREHLDKFLGAIQVELEAFDFSVARSGFSLKTNHFDWAWPESCTDKFDFLSHWGLEVLLRVLPVDQILFLVGCLLLELKVVVVSKDPATLSAALYGLLPLLRPCRWIQPFIPLLPQSLSVVCDAPVPVLVGSTTTPPKHIQSNAAEQNEEDENPPSPSTRDTGRQEAVIVLLDSGELQLSKALATSYHALKLPGLSQLYHDIETEIIPGPEKVARTAEMISKHIANVLRAANYFGQAAATLAVSSTLPGKAALEAEDQLEKLIPSLGRAVTVSSPWQYLARVQVTQMFLQWLDTKGHCAERFQLTSLLSPQ